MSEESAEAKCLRDLAQKMIFFPLCNSLVHGEKHKARFAVLHAAEINL